MINPSKLRRKQEYTRTYRIVVGQIVTYLTETRPDRTETKETNETPERKVLRMDSKLQSKHKKKLRNEEV
jgi:hypothetical protein